MSRFQVSKFKNIELNQSASFGTGPLCNIVDWPVYGTHSQLIHSSGTCLASYVGNGRVTVNSSLPEHSHLLDIHCSSICDLSFSPFHDDFLAITSQDNHVNLYKLPIKISTDCEFISDQNSAQQLLTIPAKNSKLFSARFHSVVSDVLAQASETDFSLLKFDTSSSDYEQIFSKQFSDNNKLLTFAFSETSLLFAHLNENSGIFLQDPRTDDSVQQTTFKTTLKNCPRIAFLENSGTSNYLLSTSDNNIQIWDRRSFTSSILSTFSQNDSKLIPLIDHDTGLVFFVTYNSGLVIVSEEKQLLSGNGFNTAYSTYQQHKFRSASLASKRVLQYDVPEIDRLYGLTSSKIVPMQFYVPRKVPEKFFGEYYPPTKSPFNQKNWCEILSDDFVKASTLNLHPQVNSFVDKFALFSKDDPSQNENGHNTSEEEQAENVLPPGTSKTEQYAPQTDKADGNIIPKCKFLRGNVDLKKKIEFLDEIYDGLATMRLMKTGRNIAVMPLGRNACDTLAIVNLSTGQLQTFQAESIITDYTVDPFIEDGGQLISVGTNGGDVYLIDAKINANEVSITSSHLSACHRGAIVKVAFHSMFANTLITVGKEDNLVQIWSVTNDRKLESICSQTLASGGDSIFEICWNKSINGGNRLAVLLKSKDSIEKIAIFEYCRRSFTLIHTITLPKFCFMVSVEWIVHDQFILATGRHRGDMKLFIWDTVADYRLITDNAIDSNPYSLYSNFDEDTGTLFLVPKGDRQIYIFGVEFEEESRTLKLHRFDPFQTSTRVLACSFGQKINCDVMKMEIANGHVLSDGFIAPFSLVVPRKNMENFDDSLFPTTIPYWKPQFSDRFEMNDPSSYNSIQRYSLQPDGTACVSSIVNDSSQNKNNNNANTKMNITINQAIENPYLAMQVKDQIESSLSTMISNFTVDEDIDIGRGRQNFDNESDEETDWD